jgi:hypothetical protein
VRFFGYQIPYISWNSIHQTSIKSITAHLQFDSPPEVFSFQVMCSFLEAFVQRTWQAEVHKHAFCTFSRPTVAPVVNKLVGRPMSGGCFSGHLFGNQIKRRGQYQGSATK